MIKILCWYWKQDGGRTQYGPHHVNIWAGMVRRHLSIPHTIACVTDSPEGIDASIEIIAPPKEFEDWRIPTWAPGRPQCLRRIAMFAPDAAKRFGERFVCMDIDCIVTNSLDRLFSDTRDFKIFRGTMKGRPYNGSMMMLRAGSRPQVYEKFTPEGAAEAGRQFVGSDQAWISYCLGPHEATWGPADGVEWWSKGRPIVTSETRIIFFPGDVKPWEVSNPYVRRHYRGKDDRKCLILGYSKTVWTEVEAALKKSDFDVVIASPEAAEHWPGPVYAVAENDAIADDIAQMCGFDHVVFCGRSEDRAA